MTTAEIYYDKHAASDRFQINELAKKVSKRWSKCFTLALEDAREDTSYFGSRVNAEYVARSAYQSGKRRLNDDQLIEEIHSAAHSQWVYEERENRG